MMFETATMQTAGRLIRAAVMLPMLAWLSACGGGDSDSSGTPAAGTGGGGGAAAGGGAGSGSAGSGSEAFAVDPSAAPALPALHGFDGMQQRPLASLHDHELGITTSFVANELVVVTGDEDELQAIIDELGAEKLAAFDPESIGLPDRPDEHLLRVDPSGTETSDLADTLASLGEDTEGEFSVSSQSGLELLALAARQREAGRRVSPNWAGHLDGFTDGEALEDGSGPVSQDVFDWPSHGRDTTQDIDVVTAWQMLERTVDVGSGSDVDLSPGSVRIAILDGGFAPGDDFLPNGYILPFWIAVNPLGFDPIDTEGLSTCSGGNPCPWHGTKVASAAMAVPDNEYGSAGPAGPIAEPLFITTQVDRFSTLLSFDEAVFRDAQVINMSYSIWGPRIWAQSQGLTGDLDAYTESLRNLGILVFASMPNDGNDYGSAPRRNVHIAPCHNAKVICVNGLMWDSRTRASNSAYGGGVDIAAPYTLPLGPTPDVSGMQWGSGNSYAAPFTAGVAALIMHANPDLGADEVEGILFDTAHESPDSSIPRYVNAAGAVREALVQNGFEPIRIMILRPGEGDSISRATALDLAADALDLDDGVPDIEWRLEGGEVLGSGASVALGPDPFGSAGEYTVVATASGENGTVSDRVTFRVVNDPPTMEITNPADGAVYTQEESIALSGTSLDLGDLEPLPDGDVAWHVDGASSPLDTGHDASLDASTLALGSHEIRFVGTVGEVTGDDAVSIEVVEASDDPPPSVQITAPDNGTSYDADQQDGEGQWYVEVTLTGSVSDNMPLDSSDIVWTTSVGGGSPQMLGTGTTVSGARLYAPECFGNSHEITLTVTDSEGQSRSFSIEVTVSRLC